LPRTASSPSAAHTYRNGAKTQRLVSHSGRGSTQTSCPRCAKQLAMHSDLTLSGKKALQHTQIQHTMCEHIQERSWQDNICKPLISPGNSRLGGG
jgi:hypothetical protein